MTSSWTSSWSWRPLDVLDATRRALADWLKSGPHAAVLGNQLDIDGTLSASQVIARLESNSSDDPMTALHLALQLATYALFIASNGLERSEEQSLSRETSPCASRP